MHRTYGTVLLLAALTVAAAPAWAQSNCTLVIHVDGFRNQKGDVGVSLFTSPDGWPEKNDNAFLHGPHPFSGDKTTVTLEVPAGLRTIRRSFLRRLISRRPALRSGALRRRLRSI